MRMTLILAALVLAACGDTYEYPQPEQDAGADAAPSYLEIDREGMVRGVERGVELYRPSDGGTE